MYTLSETAQPIQQSYLNKPEPLSEDISIDKSRLLEHNLYSTLDLTQLSPIYIVPLEEIEDLCLPSTPAKKYNGMKRPQTLQVTIAEQQQQEKRKYVSPGKVPKAKYVSKGKPYLTHKINHKDSNIEDSGGEQSTSSESDGDETNKEYVSENELAGDEDIDETILPPTKDKQKTITPSKSTSEFKNPNTSLQPNEKSKRKKKNDSENQVYEKNLSPSKKRKTVDNETGGYASDASCHSNTSDKSRSRSKPKTSGYISDVSCYSITSNKSRSRSRLKTADVNMKIQVDNMDKRRLYVNNKTKTNQNSRIVKISTLYPEFENSTTWPITPNDIFVTNNMFSMMNNNSYSNTNMCVLTRPNIIISKVIKSVLRNILIDYKLNKCKKICFDVIIDNILKGMLSSLNIPLSADKNVNIMNICKIMGKEENIDYTKMNNTQIEEKKDMSQGLQLCLILINTDRERNMCEIDMNSIDRWCQSLSDMIQQIVSEHCILMAQSHIENGRAIEDEYSNNPRLVMEFIRKMEEAFVNTFNPNLLRMLEELYKLNELCTYLIFGIKVKEDEREKEKKTFTKELALQLLLANASVGSFNLIGNEEKLLKNLLCMPLAHLLQLGDFGNPGDTSGTVQFVDDREDITGIMKFLASAKSVN